MASKADKVLNYVLVSTERGNDPILRGEEKNDKLWSMIPHKGKLDIIMKAGNVVETYAVPRDTVDSIKRYSVYYGSALQTVHVYSLLKENRNTVYNIHIPDENEKLTIE